MEESKTPSPPSLAGYTPWMQKFDDLLDRVSQLIYTTARTDPSTAPRSLRPVVPHIALRAQQRKSRLKRLTVHFD